MIADSIAEHEVVVIPAVGCSAPLHIIIAIPLRDRRERLRNSSH